MFADVARAALQSRRAAGLLRARRVVEPIDATHARVDGRVYTVFAGNDYLGLSHHPAVKAAGADLPAGSGAAALVTGRHEIHAEAERRLAAWKGAEGALLLPSGWQANAAAVSACAGAAKAAGRPVRFLVDKLAHASLLDAVRATGELMRVFLHNGLAKLGRLLADRPADEVSVVVTESVFSMDGDRADLAGLRALKRRHPFALVLDEAHASGVFGAGLGGAEVDLGVATLGKGLGVVGGCVYGSTEAVEAVVNFGRAYVYTTAPSPRAAAGVIAALDVLAAEPGRATRVCALARRFRAALGLDASEVPIVPVVFGDAGRAVEASERLREQGFWVPAIRPPTVAPGSSRLRVTLCSEHTEGEVDALARALVGLRGLTQG